MLLRGLFIIGLLASACAHRPSNHRAAFAKLTADYLSAYYRANPIRATSLGIHDYDGALPDLSAKGVAARLASLDAFIAKLQQIDSGSLPLNDQLDYAVLLHAMQAEKLEIETVQSWRKNPSTYNRILAGSAATLVDRPFAPVEDRVAALMARWAQFPSVIAAAKANLQGVPKLWAELAIRSTRGTVAFLENDVSLALEAQGYAALDPAVKARFEAAQKQAVIEARGFLTWLEKDVLPSANGDYRLGRDVFEKKLFYEEHFSLSADVLRTMNEAAIVRYQDWVKREAAKIDPKADPADVMRAITEKHPTPQTLLETARGYVKDAQAFVVERKVVTLPSNDLPIVRESPKYSRLGFASMSTPGPFETRAVEAYYNITNVESDWTTEKKHQHLTYFNFPGLLGISIHEAMPGHFVQLLYRSQVPTDVRKVFSTASLIEGWAHYVEQMMLDEGFHDQDPVVRLAQLRRALQRHARWYAALAIHVDGKPVDEVAKRFEKIAYFAPFPALRETQRATYNPTYLYYALGRMEILSLREAYAEQEGSAYSLRTFHDRFLTLGLPIPLARRVLLEAVP